MIVKYTYHIAYSYELQDGRWAIYDGIYELVDGICSATDFDHLKMIIIEDLELDIDPSNFAIINWKLIN